MEIYLLVREVFFFILSLLENSFIGIAVGAAIGYLLNYHFAARQQLSYQYKTVPYMTKYKTLIEQQLSEHPTKVARSNLHRSFIVIWNSGNKYIEAKALSKSMPLVIHGYSIQNVSKIVASRSSSNVSVIQSDNEIEVDFDYLKPNEGFVIQLTHLSSWIKVSGDLKTSKKNIKNCGSVEFYYGSKFFKYLSVFFFVGTAVQTQYYLEYGEYHFALLYSPHNAHLIAFLSLFAAIFSLILAKKTHPSKLRFDGHKFLE